MPCLHAPHITYHSFAAITAPVLPETWCAAPCSALLIHKRGSLAMNIALPERQRTSLLQIDNGRQRPVIKSPCNVMRQKY